MQITTNTAFLRRIRGNKNRLQKVWTLRRFEDNGVEEERTEAIGDLMTPETSNSLQEVVTEDPPREAKEEAEDMAAEGTLP